MLELIITVILCFFASIGMAYTYNRYISGIFKSIDGDLNMPSVVFTVKNREKDIEAYLRSFIWKSVLNSGNGDVMQILVIDLDSEDETMSILKKLEQEYDFLNVFTRQGYINILNQN